MYPFLLPQGVRARGLTPVAVRRGVRGMHFFTTCHKKTFIFTFRQGILNRIG